MSNLALHHRLLAAAYYPLKGTKIIGRPLGLASRDRLRVLVYHDVAPHELARFTDQLLWLRRSWNFVSPDRFARMVSGAERMRGRNLLLAFDDGFTSNRVVAEEVLNPIGIRALFFVVSALVGSRPQGPRAPRSSAPGKGPRTRWSFTPLTGGAR